ncbi:beta-N-acetylhexosaminidase [Caldanaerobius fijiensis DSM 17918]|uniref:beta-N-acetylhexosaminidase n=1 Tax=Caldanaerobius fijiensis DSM 17918 TaxID=1121256 RepID=A0A1M4VNN6_9THEO|nr:glycoside hydrolase family 3 protein [Caldanaerobius fijiensis]SHE70538.1 beta-N-acetylhexosaminidase [Caldanaerobius fijiensis DSM 17918]
MKNFKIFALLIISLSIILNCCTVKSKYPINKKETKKPNRYDFIDNYIKNMTLEEKIGQMFMPAVYYDGDKTQLEKYIKMIKDYKLGGVILFPESLDTAQLVNLTYTIQNASKIPLFISTDQEGGLVYRLKDGTKLPGNMAIGATRSTDLAYKNGQVVGSELKAVGINWNLAPVADVNSNPANPIIGIRSFGGFPDLVSRMTVAYMKGEQSQNIATCLKHFPGHGDVNIDSHLGLGIVNKSIDQLEKNELKPFSDAIKAGADAVMSAHLSFPALDDTKIEVKTSDGTIKKITIPATLSQKILTGVLREKLGFKGVIITDAMNMRAISDNFNPIDATIRAIKAGADIVLMPVDLQGSYDELLKQVKNGSISEYRIDQSVKRILSLKNKIGILNRPTINLEKAIDMATKILSSNTNKAIERETAQKAITLVRDNKHIIPLKNISPPKKILVVAGNKVRIDQYIAQIRKYYPYHIDTLVVDDAVLNSNKELSNTTKAAINGADIIIIGTVDITEKDNQIVKILNNYGREKIIILIAIKNPYDIMYYPNAETYLVQYGWNRANYEAVVDVIFGGIKPTGRLPVNIPGC